MHSAFEWMRSSHRCFCTVWVWVCCRCFCSDGRDTQGDGPFQFTNPGGNKRYSCTQHCKTCDVRTRHRVWREAVHTIKTVEDAHHAFRNPLTGERQEGADRRRAQRIMDLVTATSEEVEGQRLARIDLETNFPDAEPVTWQTRSLKRTSSTCASRSRVCCRYSAMSGWRSGIAIKRTRGASWA